MTPKNLQNHERRKTEKDERLDPAWGPVRDTPVIGKPNLAYEVGARVDAIPCGGIGLIHQMVLGLGLPDLINEYVSLFKVRKPYWESDHVLNIAYNVLAGGTCLEDIERLRDNVAYLNALGCRRVPDQTTAGDFLRRFDEEQVELLMEAINQARLRAWEMLPAAEKRLALVDVDGTLAPTLGECKEGMDVTYKGDWGYHPLVVTLANTQEVLYTKNRPGNRPSHDDAVTYMDAAVALALAGGFGRVRLRGDTDFSLTRNFDRWTSDGVEFVFGIDAHPSFVAKAKDLPEEEWKPLNRRQRAKPATQRRARPTNVKEIIVRERGYRSLALEAEHIAELPYTPSASTGCYRLVVVRKTIKVTQGALRLMDEVRYFFYVTNVPRKTLRARAVVFEANARCNQENVIEQLKNGVRAFRMPSDTLVSNWAYLVIASLAWNLKAWLAILLPQESDASEIRRMEFRRFLNSIMLIPCQVIRTARRTVLRILAYTKWVNVIFEGLDYFKRLRWP